MLWSYAYGCSISLHIRSVYLGYPTGSVLGFTCGYCICIYRLYESEALPGVLGNRGTRAIFSGEQGNKGLKIRRTGEHRQFLGTGNIANQDFVFGEQGHFFEGNRYPPPPPREGLESGNSRAVTIRTLGDTVRPVTASWAVTTFWHGLPFPVLIN